MDAKLVGWPNTQDPFAAFRNGLRSSDTSVEQVLAEVLAKRASEAGSSDLPAEELDAFTKSILSCYSLRYLNNNVQQIKIDAITDYLNNNSRPKIPFIKTTLLAIAMFFAASAVDNLYYNKLQINMLSSEAFSAQLPRKGNNAQITPTELAAHGTDLQ